MQLFKSMLRGFKDFYEAQIRKPHMDFVNFLSNITLSTFYLALRIADGKLWKQYQTADRSTQVDWRKTTAMLTAWVGVTLLLLGLHLTKGDLLGETIFAAVGFFTLLVPIFATRIVNKKDETREQNLIDTGSTNPDKYRRVNSLGPDVAIPETETIRKAAKLISERPKHCLGFNRKLEPQEMSEETALLAAPAQSQYTNYEDTLTEIVNDVRNTGQVAISNNNSLSDEKKVQAIMKNVANFDDAALTAWKSVIAGENGQSPRFRCSGRGYADQFPLRMN